MPVLNVGPTVRQDRTYVPSEYEILRSTSKTIITPYPTVHADGQTHLMTDMFTDKVIGSKKCLCAYVSVWLNLTSLQLTPHLKPSNAGSVFLYFHLPIFSTLQIQ